MKKIGILFGQEHSFPPAFVERVNAKTGGNDIRAEFVRIDKVIQGEPCGYDVVIDRISQDVPFYRALAEERSAHRHRGREQSVLVERGREVFQQRACDQDRRRRSENGAAALASGAAGHERQFVSQPRLIRSIGKRIFYYVGWPAFFKPFAGGGWKNVYRLHNSEEFFRAYCETGQLVMMLQEEVKFDMYFRCYSIDQRNVRIMPYEPRHPYHLRYQTEWQAPREILQKVEEGVLALNQYLGYDLNTVEFAIRDGVPVAIDFCNPAPDAEAASVGQANFEWVVEAVSDMAIRKAREHVPGRDNLSWGKYLQAAVTEALVRRNGLEFVHTEVSTIFPKVGRTGARTKLPFL